MTNKIFHKRDKDSIIIFVHGYDGGAEESWSNIMEKILQKDSSPSLLAFTSKNNKPENLKEYLSQANEIANLVNWSTRENFKEIYIVATSSGAFSTSILLENKLLASKISIILFLDPSDYEMDDEFISNDEKEYLWSGHLDYNPSKNIGIKYLKNLPDNLKIHTVHFAVKNYGEGRYIQNDQKMRSIDDQNGFSRLNTQMVKSYYKILHPKNRGEYIEINNLPHAFRRDGDVEKNSETLADIIMEMIA